MERFNQQIENAPQNDAETENQDRLLRESEIRQEMRIEHAKRLLELGVDVDTINKATDLRADFIEQLREMK